MISLHACKEYEQEQIAAAVRSVMDDLGGWGAFVTPGESVLLKVNLVFAAVPETMATSHPAFVAEIARELRDFGCEVWIGDSPGGPFNENYLKSVYRKCEMDKAAEESGAMLCYDTGTRSVENPEGKLLKRLTLTEMSQKFDKVISLAKIKTHAMMTYTGVTKNLFGTVPGTEKPELHMRMPEATDFANALLDIYLAAKPCLCLMDGIVGMEGNGPTGGTPRTIGLVGGAASGPELDLVCADIIGLKCKDVPLLAEAHKRGMIPEDAAQVEVTGDAPAAFAVPDFRMPDHIDSSLTSMFVPKIFRKAANRLLRPRVTFDRDICRSCGQCAEACPAKTITMVLDEKTGRRFPKANYENCIRCYCCQELCHFKAIKIVQPVAFKIANKM